MLPAMQRHEVHIEFSTGVVMLWNTMLSPLLYVLPSALHVAVREIMHPLSSIYLKYVLNIPYSLFGPDS